MNVRFDEVVVRLRQFAPVQAWLVMMDGVVPVVEEQKVNDRAGEVAGMVVGMLLVAAIMLRVINPHNAPSSEEVG